MIFIYSSYCRTQIILASIVPSLNNIIDVRMCFIKCHEAGFMDIYEKSQCYIDILFQKKYIDNKFKIERSPYLVDDVDHH